MKKVAIISYNLYSNHMNYGAALHSYAFQQYLKMQGVDSVIVDYYPKSLEHYNIKFPILNNISFWHPRGFLKDVINWGLGFRCNLQKYKKFKIFFNKNLKCTKKKYTYSELLSGIAIPEIEDSILVCESDVIWKLYEENGFDEVFFLNFPGAEGKRKVSYAPSLGSRLFNDKEQVRLKQLLSGFYAISTREEQGAQYLSKVIGKPVEWMLDPTLLLDASFYTKLAKKPLETNYVLLYNCMMDDAAMVHEAELYAKAKGLMLVEISNFYINKLKYNHKVVCNAGIEEWLGYFKYADSIICNAFHGFCFSVIFRKNVFLFLRDNSDYRMKNITDALGVSDRLIHFENKTIPSEITEIDYDLLYKKLHILKLKSYNYIKTNIISL